MKTGEKINTDKPSETWEKILNQAVDEFLEWFKVWWNGTPKVYVGRRSLNMGDDANHPNMFNFYLPDNPDEVIKAMFGHGLPSYTSWEGYLGKREHSRSEEDGITVYSRFSDEVIFTISKEKDQMPTYKFTKGWYKKIKAHPYIYCE